jgi:hypothetical protein
VGEAGGGKCGQRQQGSSLHRSLLVLWLGAVSSARLRQEEEVMGRHLLDYKYNNIRPIY